MNETEESYSTEINVTATPETVFKAITSEIDKWWTTSSNEALVVGDKLEVRFGKTTYKVMSVTKSSPNEAIDWKVEEANIGHEGLFKKNEWVGTTINWTIEGSSNGSNIFFTHTGLVPSFECYDVCQGGWNYFLMSLKNFLNTGKGTPFIEVNM